MGTPPACPTFPACPDGVGGQGSGAAGPGVGGAGSGPHTGHGAAQPSGRGAEGCAVGAGGSGEGGAFLAGLALAAVAAVRRRRR